MREKLKKIKLLYYPYRLLRYIKRSCLYHINYMKALCDIARNKKRIKQKLHQKEKINVLFIIQYIPSWNKLEPIYFRMKEDERFNPIIVCVPLNIQNNKLMDEYTDNDTYEYFVKHGYDVINALKRNRDWYNLKQLKPDYVFHSRPYNHFMPQCYTSDSIRKYALVCNVLYGANVSVNVQDITLNREYYKNVCYYFSFDVNEKKFFDRRFALGCKLGIQKSLPYGAIGLEQMLQARNIQKNYTFKKVVLWTPRWSTDSYVGGSNFFNYRNTILNLARENKDILFILRPHPLMFDNFIKTKEMTEKEVRGFKQYCNNENNIILDESKEYADKFWNSDMLITDASGMVAEYFITEKPILYCHSNVQFNYVDYAKDMIKSCYEVNNKKELTDYFYQLVSGEDVKLEDRKKCIDAYFADTQNNSTKILNTLANLEA